MKQDFETIKELLCERLCAKRYQHSLNVADEALRLALHYGEDTEKAYQAGLLHDICKDEAPEQQLQRMLDSVIIWDDKALMQPPLWHSLTGAIFIRDELNITDEDMINAVKYHTSARAGMSKLEQIVYLADLTSADRTYRDIDQMRSLADESLEDAMLYALQFCIGDLVTHAAPIVNDTIEAYHEYALRGKNGVKAFVYQ